tara:strand:+ start:5910 stop:8786 length:2877 start_codon:yes stop_codon:yes gene_type:complete
MTSKLKSTLSVWAVSLTFVLGPGCGLLLHTPAGVGPAAIENSDGGPVTEDKDPNDNSNDPPPETGTLTLSPNENSGYPGELLRFSAKLAYESDRSDDDVTGDCQWLIEDDNVATLDSAGTFLAQNPGETSGTVTYGEESLTFTLRVLDLTEGLSTLSIDPPTVDIPTTFAITVRAMGFYENGEARNLSGLVAWTVGDQNIATISTETDEAIQVQGLASGTTQLTATFGEQEAVAELSVALNELQGIELVPSELSIPKNTSAQLKALGAFAGGDVLDITESLTWETADTARAIVSNEVGSKGLVSALAQGSVTIKAYSEDQIVGLANLDVTAEQVSSLTIVPPLLSVPAGATVRVRADAVMVGGGNLEVTNQGSWAIGDENIAVLRMMNDDRILVEGVSPGNTTLSISYGDVTEEVSLIVTAAELDMLEIWPTDLTLPAGDSENFYAIGTYTDGSRAGLTAMVQWTSSDPAIAFVSSTPEPGLLTTLTAGSVTITASVEGTIATTTVNVTAAALVGVQVHPPIVALPAGDDGNFKAFAVYSDNTMREVTDDAAWSIDDTAVATISNADGQEGSINTRSAGGATVKATYEAFSDEASLTVTDAALDSLFITPWYIEITPNRNEWLTAVGRYGDGSTRIITDRVTWSTSNDAVVQVSNLEGTAGRITSISNGTAVIYAQLDGKTDGREVIVVDADMIDIGIWPEQVGVSPGLTQGVNAYALYEQEGVENWITGQAVWTSDNEAIAIVDNYPEGAGRITGISHGITTVTATLGNFTATTEVHVHNREVISLELGPPNPILPPDRSQEFVAIATFDVGPSQDVTRDTLFESSNASVAATLTAFPGWVSTGVAGEATITGTVVGVSATTSITVRAADPTNIIITPSNDVFQRGRPHQFYATALYEDNSTSDITELCTWSSSNSDVMIIFDENNAKGRAWAINVGNTTITAICDGTVATTSATAN